MKLKQKRLAQEWFGRAESDLLYARAGEKETGKHHITCFLCHQAVEKVLKGMIVGLGGVFQKTHSLRVSGALVRELDPAVNLDDGDFRKLDAYYIPSRYPGPVEKEFSKKDAEIAIEIADKMISQVLRRD